MFTPVQVIWGFQGPLGADQGTVEFSPSVPMIDTSTGQEVAGKYSYTLDAGGWLGSTTGIALYANNDSTTQPLGTYWRALVKLVGAAPREYGLTLYVADAGHPVYATQRITALVAGSMNQYVLASTFAVHVGTIASPSVLGHVRIGTGITIDPDGTIHAAGGGGGGADPRLTGTGSLALGAFAAALGASGTLAITTDSRFSDARVPTGTAGGALSGTYPAPGLAATSVVPGAYTSANITVGADGRLTAATSGGGGGGADPRISGTGSLALGAFAGVLPDSGTIDLIDVSQTITALKIFTNKIKMETDPVAAMLEAWNPYGTAGGIRLAGTQGAYIGASGTYGISLAIGYGNNVNIGTYTDGYPEEFAIGGLLDGQKVSSSVSTDVHTRVYSDFTAKYRATVGNDISALTNTLDPILVVRHNTTGTPAAGFGSALLFRLQSDPTPNRDAAQIAVSWVTATDAGRLARLTLSALDSTGSREGMRVESSGTAPLLGFYGVPAVGRATAAAVATDLASALALANSLRTILINLGLAS